jgi:hypothetical protein
MLILTFGVRQMVLPFIEVDFGHPTLLTKAVDKPARHFDRPYPIIRPMADEQRAVVAFDLNRG